MLKVLIADDEKIVRIALKTMIKWEEHGFQLVGGAQDGAAALALTEKVRPDIIITDLKMPGMDGLAFIEKLQERNYPGKIIVLSNYGDYDLVRKAMKSGAIDYLLKITLKPQELLDLLHKASEQIVAEKQQKEQDIRVNFALMENHMLLKKQFFQQLLLDDTPAAHPIRLQAEKLGIQAGLALSYLLYIVIEQFERALTDGKIKDKNLLAFSVGNIVREMVGEDTRIEIAELSYKEFVVVLPAGDSESFEQRKQQILRRIPAVLKMYLNVQVGVAASPAFTGLERMREACIAAMGELSNVQAAPEGKKFRREVATVIDFMKTHLDTKLTLPKIAGLVNLNESYLCRLFKSETGKNIVHYLNDLRMEKARELLKDRDLKVKEVAALVGIYDQYYFNRMFHKYYGQSPSDFKKIADRADGQNNLSFRQPHLF